MIRLAIRVRRADAELALAELLELAPSGVEEVDLGGDVVEYAVYGPSGELPTLPDLRAAAGGALVEVTTSELADDWDERWKAFHEPLLLDRLTVRPPWAPGEARPGVPEVVIDPGQAFGTGAHATTRMCLELLLETEPAGPFADWGCGSGVLAIAAAKLGFSPLLGVDHDPASVAATAENAAANGVDVEARRVDLRAEPAPWAPTAAANLMRPLLLEVAGRLEHAPSRLIVSGLLREEAEEVGEAFARHGLRVTARCERGEWAALALEA